MPKYIAAGGIALSILYLLSEIGIEMFGNMLKIQRENNTPIKVQVKNAMMKRN